MAEAFPVDLRQLADEAGLPEDEVSEFVDEFLPATLDHVVEDRLLFGRSLGHRHVRTPGLDPRIGVYLSSKSVDENVSTLW